VETPTGVSAVGGVFTARMKQSGAINGKPTSAYGYKVKPGLL